MSLGFYFEITGIVVALIGLALFSAIQRALVGLNRHRAGTLADENPRKAAGLRLWTTDPNQLLASMMVAVIALTTMAGILGTLVAIELAGVLAVSEAAVVFVGSVLLVLALIVFGDILPRIVAVHNSDRVALRLIGFLYLVNRVLAPLTKAITRLLNGITRIFGGRPAREGLFVTEPDLSEAVERGEQEAKEAEEHTEHDMVTSIFELGDTVVREVMVPRPDMKCISENATLDEALEVMVGGGFSRVPMFRDDLDNIVGVLYAKDLLRYVGMGRRNLSLKDLARPAYFVPETKKIDELLRELQRKKIHLAVVVDEYGGTAGLVTIEDLLEEIVGEIFDEYDLEEALVESLDQESMRLDARYPYDDLSDLLGVEFPEDAEVDTVGGFVFSLIGRVPEAGERVEYRNLTFVVEKVLGNRIRKVVVRRAPAGKAESDGESPEREGQHEE